MAVTRHVASSACTNQRYLIRVEVLRIGDEDDPVALGLVAQPGQQRKQGAGPQPLAPGCDHRHGTGRASGCAVALMEQYARATGLWNLTVRSVLPGSTAACCKGHRQLVLDHRRGSQVDSLSRKDWNVRTCQALREKISVAAGNSVCQFVRDRPLVASVDEKWR